jgi:hypothetical protein
VKRTDQRMFDLRSIRLYTQLTFVFLLLTAFCISINAQESAAEKEKEKSEGKKKAGSTEMVNIKGSVRCEKADPAYQIDVPDRPGHSLIIAHRKCTWTEPLVILGAKTKEGVWDTFTERMEGSLRPHSYEVDTLDDGEKITMQTMGQVDADKGPTKTKGRWSFMRGTGKFKGIKGGGTYEGELGADDVLTLELAGVYEPSEMVGGKKSK